MLLRLACLAATNAFAALRLLPMGDRDKDVEVLVLRHQITVLERQLGADARVRFVPEDRPPVKRSLWRYEHQDENRSLRWAAAATLTGIRPKIRPWKGEIARQYR
ncbi:hypothetical protein FH608_043360 [Nonomuraea phyllanthi]|uniref:Uncharacterized protein n=1 Tax=Nonomuraea phyllanthi TaxID=2219224 RepID=A0A5C4VE06_9ACTN|nr:hypothetical protein FH608_043360 [Nonomuraea phyllanthi]